MSGVAFTLVLIALFAVVLVLALGLWNMKRGGDPNRSQKLMRWRIILQFSAIILIMIFIYLSSTS